MEGRFSLAFSNTEGMRRNHGYSQGAVPIPYIRESHLLAWYGTQTKHKPICLFVVLPGG
jgi:hypothetical protein